MPDGRLHAILGIITGIASLSLFLSDSPPFPWPAALERAASKSWESRLRTSEGRHLDVAARLHMSASVSWAQFPSITPVKFSQLPEQVSGHEQIDMIVCAAVIGQQVRMTEGSRDIRRQFHST